MSEPMDIDLSLDELFAQRLSLSPNNGADANPNACRAPQAADYTFRDIPPEGWPSSSGPRTTLHSPLTPATAPDLADPLATRFTHGNEKGKAPPSTHRARRFLFYPVPDDVEITDLRVSLAARLGPVERIRVIDGLADVRFKAPLGHAALHYRELQDFAQLTPVRECAIDGVSLTAFMLPVRATAPPRRPRSVASGSRGSAREHGETPKPTLPEHMAQPKHQRAPLGITKPARGRQTEEAATRARMWREHMQKSARQAAEA